MRIKHILVTGVALATLFGCGTNNESLNDRGLNNVENVRNHPTQRENYQQDVREYPNASDGAWDQNRRDPNNIDQSGMTDDRTDYNESRHRGDMLEDGRRHDGEENYDVADEIADRVTSEVDDIERAYVLTMGNNAYVACQLDNDNREARNDDVSDKLEREVTDAVQDADKDIDNVFVSSNPDFIDLTSNYMRDIDRGEPIEGFFDQFTEMIERIFPTRD